jgi:hypothetical protein
MSDKAQTAEAVAYQLMIVILDSNTSMKRSKDDLLTLYTDCLKTVKGSPNSMIKPKATAKQEPQLAGATAWMGS